MLLLSSPPNRPSRSATRKPEQPASPLQSLVRARVVKQLDDIFSAQRGVGVVVLHGPSGAGKTETARLYAQKLAAQSAFTFTINATTAATRTNGFYVLASALANTNALREELRIIRAVTPATEEAAQEQAFIRARLQALGNWLIIFDDAQVLEDIPEPWLETPTDAPHTASTRAQHSRILITTRNEKLAERSAIPPENVLSLGELDEQEKMHIFQQICPDEACGKEPYDAAEVQRFLSCVPGLPLDLVAAAHYLRNTKTGIRACVTRLQAAPDGAAKTTSSLPANEASRYRILCAIFERILRGHADFRGLLLLSCMVSPHELPAKALVACSDQATTDKFIAALNRYSLLSPSSPSPALHKSVQSFGLLYLQTILPPREMAAYIDMIVHAFTPLEKLCAFAYKAAPDPHTEELKRLAPHLAALKDSLLLSDRNRARVLATLGLMEASNNRPAAALPYLEKLLAIPDVDLHLSPRERIVALLSCASCLSQTQGYRYAEPLFRIAKKLASSLDDNASLLASYYLINGRAQLQCGLFKDGDLALDSCIRAASPYRAESWGRHVLAQAYYLRMSAYCDYYLMKDKGQDISRYAQQALRLVHATPPFRSHPRAVPPQFVQIILQMRHGLAQYYNLVGAYKKALEEGSLEIDYIQKHFPEHPFIVEKFLGLTEQGRSLSWIGAARQAERKLTDAMEAFQRIGLQVYALEAQAYRAEARLRLGAWRLAYADCIACIRNCPEPQNNWQRLRNRMLHYHAAVAQARLNHADKARQHLSDFLVSMQAFCERFCTPKEFTLLRQRGAFGPILYNAGLRDGFARSEEILATLFGAQHPFIKKYISKNTTLSLPETTAA